MTYFGLGNRNLTENVDFGRRKDDSRPFLTYQKLILRVFSVFILPHKGYFYRKFENTLFFFPDLRLPGINNNDDDDDGDERRRPFALSVCLLTAGDDGDACG